MKRFMLLCHFLFLGCGLTQLWAQPNLTRADVYNIGDTAEYFALDATNAVPGPAGVGVTWDFSNLPRIPDQDYVVYYEAASVAPNAAMFPQANMVAIQNAGPIDAYTFINVTDQRITLEGLDLPDLGVVTYSDKDIWLNFPLGYNQTQADDFVGTYTFNVQGFSGIADRTGNLSTHYDGFGTLILPGGVSVPNVRRLRLEQTVTDVVHVAGTTVTTVVESVTYNFFEDGDRRQLFQLTLADSTITPPGMTVSSKLASYREAGGSSSLVARRGAHLTVQGGDFDSEILVHNPTDSAQVVTLQPLDGNGGELAAVNVNLAAGATSRVLQQQYFSSAAKSFVSSGCDGCIFSVGYRATSAEGSTAQVHQTDRFEDEFYFYPGEWNLLFDGAAIVNAGNTPAKVEAYQLDYDGQMIEKVTLVEDLAPGAKFLTIFNSLFDNIPDSMVKLQADQPMAVMILRISSDNRFLYQNLPLPPVPDAEDGRWIAHITSENGGFDTDVLLHNGSATGKKVILHPFTPAGVALDPVEVTVPGGATRRFAKTELFSDDTSHASITGATECLVSVGYRAKAPDSSTADIHEAPPVGNTFFLYPGEWDLLFDGVAMVNTGDGDATVTVTQIGDDGSIRGMAVLVDGLAPRAKYLGLLEGLVDEDPQSIIRVESTQPLAILSLRLSKDSRYLYNNPPLPQ